MNYLVTGGSGFIGSHLVEKLLQNGHSVVNVDNFDDFYDYQIKIQNTLESVGSDIKFYFNEKLFDILSLIKIINTSQYRLYYQDVREKDGMEEIFHNHNFDIVIHLAALAGVRFSIDNPLEYEEVNIRGTMNLLELCKKFGVKKFLCASSSSVYGNNEKIPFSEKDFVDRPISPYAATKKCGEILSYVYHSLYQIDIIQLRFFTVYGPRQRPDLAIHKFTELMYNGNQIPFYGDGMTARDYTFIEDIIDGILKSVDYIHQHQNVYEILNLGNNEFITLDEIVTFLSELLAVRPLLNRLPMQAGDVQKTNADIQKAQTLIGYHPKIKFQNGIKIFMEWFLKKKQIKSEFEVE